ncbi:MAG: class IV adenylate cyclase [Nanoarchaeota archaeon]|nr:class IV adenylate cyclase [Nanoarchaeota archaeon]MBU1029754.1 class IV adenylate cyclase [Nanoarchaeota archaeon]
MKEIEVKILEINREELEEKLVSMGAKKVFDNEIYGLFFRIEGIENKDTLRLRKEGEETFLTLKKYIPNTTVKTRDEYEVKVSDFETARTILDLLGAKEYATIRKHRTSYELSDAHIEFDKYLDEYEFVPEFLEIEAKNEKTVFHIAKKLGFQPEECLPINTKEVIKTYSR